MGFLDKIVDIFKNTENKTDNKAKEKKKSNIKCKYNLDDINSIMAIPIPKYKPLTGLSSPVNNIEYILQRKATEHKKNGNMDLAIACLKKSNEIMPHSNFIWQQKDYLRLVEFLKIAGRFDEARETEKEILKKVKKTYNNITIKLTLKEARSLGTDLLECTSHECTCDICSKYQGRIYSISGNDKRFPKLPDMVKKYGGFHEGCRHGFSPFIYGISTPLYAGKDPIAFSNRPFIDERSKQEKQEYDAKKHEEYKLIRDKKEFDLIREFLPEFAPKSFSGYRKMKNLKSKNFIKLKEMAINKEIPIEE